MPAGEGKKSSELTPLFRSLRSRFHCTSVPIARLSGEMHGPRRVWQIARPRAETQCSRGTSAGSCLRSAAPAARAKRLVTRTLGLLPKLIRQHQRVDLTAGGIVSDDL